VISRAKIKAIPSRTATDPARAVAMLRQVAEIVDPPPLRPPVRRDQDDDALLAVAVASRADLIICGDADLLVLAAYAGFPLPMQRKPSLRLVDEGLWGLERS
jgi:putative PIN family toxin of toxin-antitoxin system